MWLKLLVLVMANLPWDRIFAFIMSKVEEKEPADPRKAEIKNRTEEQLLALEMAQCGTAEEQQDAKAALKAWAAGQPTPPEWKAKHR